jgi:hypothetical protein
MATDIFAPTLVSRNENANSASNVMFVNLSDGTDSLAINADGSVNATVSATNLDIRDLVFATDKVDVSGSSVSITGSVTVTATDLDIRDLTHVSDSVKVGDGTDFLAVNADGSINAVVTATNLDIRDLAFATDKVDVSGSSVTVSGSVTVTATDLDIRDLTLAQDAVKVSANTTANGPANPIYVALGSGPITGEIHVYDETVVSANSTSNVDYTVVTALLLKGLEVSASGGARVTLQVGPIASLVDKGSWVIPKGGDAYQIKFDPPIEVPTTGTGTARLVKVNRENQNQSIYTTLMGIDA